MAKNFNNRWLMVSQKVYGWLLRAYPPTHREEYGLAMAQLFRDQCRDAWNESQGWGVAKLWLRVLPDLVKTSFVERLAALSKRKSMSDNMALLIQPRTAFFKVFTAVFLIVLITSVAITFILPESYASTARIKVENDAPSTSYDPYYDPYFIQPQFEIMESQTVLKPVIDKLNLNVEWGKKYNGGKPLETTNTLTCLKSRIILTPVGNTKLVSITVFSEDKNEAAQIANAIAKSYKDYCVKYRATLITNGLGELQTQFKQEEETIAVLQTSLEQLRKELIISDRDPHALAPSTAILPQEQPYWDKKRELVKLIEFHKLLLAKIEAEKIDEQIPSTSMAQITDRAEPGRAPVRPNKTLNIIVGIVVGIVSASALGAIAVFVSYRINKRKQKLNATA